MLHVDQSGTKILVILVAELGGGFGGNLVNTGTPIQEQSEGPCLSKSCSIVLLVLLGVRKKKKGREEKEKR